MQRVWDGLVASEICKISWLLSEWVINALDATENVIATLSKVKSIILYLVQLISQIRLLCSPFSIELNVFKFICNFAIPQIGVS